ncbi:MAG: tetratricopeptide repeat protein [Candidatus Hydrogenedentes bacterium]|nr:tetratricopeptide repeat protein [Candidatus Hydrogenedentota bacterium]
MPIRRQKKRKTEVKDVMPTLEEQKNQIVQWWQHIKENLTLYAIGIGFVVFCVIVGSAYGAYRSSKNRDVMTKFARAMLEEKLSSRAEMLKPLLDVNSSITPQILYIYGETVFALGKFDEAETVWKKLIEKYSVSEWAPNAMEGLAYIEELRKNYDKAEKMYREITEKWPNSFIAKRQFFNIGRVLEAKNDLAMAIEAYRKQKDAFPESKVSEKANQALEKLKSEHPELFPEEKSEKVEAEGESHLSSQQSDGEVQSTQSAGEGESTPTETSEGENNATAKDIPQSNAPQPAESVQQEGQDLNTGNPLEEKSQPSSSESSNAN